MGRNVVLRHRARSRGVVFRRSDTTRLHPSRADEGITGRVVSSEHEKPVSRHNFVEYQERKRVSTDPGSGHLEGRVSAGDRTLRGSKLVGEKKRDEEAHVQLQKRTTKKEKEFLVPAAQTG